MKRDLKWISRLFGRALVYGLRGFGFVTVRGFLILSLVGASAGFFCFPILASKGWDSELIFLPISGIFVGGVLGVFCALPCAAIAFVTIGIAGFVLPTHTPHCFLNRIETPIALWMRRFSLLGAANGVIASVFVRLTGISLPNEFTVFSWCMSALIFTASCGQCFGLWLGCREWLENHRRETENSPLLEN